jgi:hypothetical protein
LTFGTTLVIARATINKPLLFYNAPGTCFGPYLAIFVEVIHAEIHV